MSKDSDLRANGSGYYDPTAYAAIKHAEHDSEPDKDDERFHKLLDMIFNICELSGFHIEGANSASTERVFH
ncbi:MAG: hypothetical protein PHW47_07125 [Lachnospira sp.]|nr:hypothetical protein [Lachnospira sp.]